MHLVGFHYKCTPDYGFGLVFHSSERLHNDGTPVPKREGD